jgi:hypothetical protein
MWRERGEVLLTRGRETIASAYVRVMTRDVFSHAEVHPTMRTRLATDIEKTKQPMLDPPPTFPRVWLRKAWPRRKFTWLVRRRQWASRSLLVWATKHNRPRGRAFQSIRVAAQHHLRTWFLDWTAAPPEWNVRLLQIAFCDFYLPEEFERLFAGLERLRSRCSEVRSFNDDRIREWIDEAHHRAVGASLNYAYLDLQKLAPRKRPTLIEGVHVWLVQISSSLITATFIADPTQKLKEHFRRLATSDRSEQPDILRLHWNRGITRMQSYHAVAARNSEYDELFLSANAEMTRILRRYLGVGLAADGPLQIVEVVGVDAQIGELPTSYERSDEDLPRWRGVSFLHSLGGRLESWRAFSTSWYRLYPVQRDDRYDIGSYQILVSAADHPKSQEASATPYSDDSSLLHSLSFVHYSLGALLATGAFYRRLRRSVLDVRNEIVPILYRRGQSRRRRRLRYGQQRISRANELAYKEERVWAELKNNLSGSWLDQEISQLKRTEDKNLHLKEMTVSAVVWHQIKSEHQFAKKQISLIRDAYREMLNYRVIETNDRLQRLVSWLTFVATVAAVASLLPEPTRVFIMGLMRAWLSRWQR